MENRLVMGSIRINGITYTAENVCTFPSEKEWQKDIRDFLKMLFDPSAEQIAFHTSGTTGPPKTICFTKQQLIRSARTTCGFFGLTESTTGLLCLPCKYVAGRLMLVRAMVSGMDLVAVSPSLFPLEEISAQPIHFAAMTPAQVYTCIRKDLPDFEKIGTVIIGGGEISAGLEEQLRRVDNSLYATYGMTETLTHVAVREIGESEYKAVDPETVFSVTDDQRLVITIPYIREEPLETTDIVELKSSASFHWLGRADNVINSGGVKLHPEQIEQKLQSADILSGRVFYVTSRKNETFGELPVLVVEHIGEPPGHSFLDILNPLLGKHEQLKAVMFVPQIFRTETGKIIRNKF